MGLYVNSNMSQVNKITQTYVPASLTKKFSTGDIMTLNLEPLGSQKTVLNYGTVPSSNTITTQNSKNGTNSTQPMNVTANQSTLNSTAMKSYGQTSLFKETLPEDTYQLGNTIKLFGNLQMVIPNTCVNVNGQVTCQYVGGGWEYRLTITCRIDQNNNCAMDDSTTRGITDGSGNYYYEWTPSTNLNTGAYLIEIQAWSQVKDPSTGLDYNLNLSKIVNLVS